MAASNHAAPRQTSTATLALHARSRDNGRMDIMLNGETRVLPSPATVAGLLQAEGLAERRVAVEVNGAIIPRSRHSEHALCEGDKVEIVHALGGG